MAQEIAFTTFLKLLQLSDGPRKTALKNLLTGKGYPYWRPLQTVAPKALLAGADLEKLKLEIEAVCSGDQLKYNKNGLIAVHNWANGKHCELVEPLPGIVADFGNSGLAIRLRPEVSFKLEENIFSMSLWATTKPALSKEALSVGLFFMRAAFRAESKKDHQFLIFDTVVNIVFSEKDILSNALILLVDKVAAFKKDWEELTVPTVPSIPRVPKEDHPALSTPKH